MSDEESRLLRVVVADDDTFTLSLVSGGLEAKGFSVTTATTVAEALDAVRAVDPHAVISDLNFGTTETGAELLQTVADEFPWIGPDAVRALRMPVLLAAGADTPAIHEAVFGNLAAVMTQAEQHRIPAAGHGAARDNPRAFNACVLDFLAREVGVQS